MQTYTITTWTCLLVLTANVFAATGHSIVRIEPVFNRPQFKRPVYVTHPRDGSDRLVVVEQAGRIYWFQRDEQNPKLHTIMDIRSRVRRQGNEEGLLGIAFAPDFATSGHIYLHYTAKRGKRRNILSRFNLNPDSLTIKPNTEQVLLQVPQPYANHNGGMIEFGPDGYLYIALGDGGSAGDPHNYAQNKASLLGSILRIDVDPNNKSYSIPHDNPFVDTPNARPEIWAYGLRNPWRFSFDRKNGQLWAADVGQVKWEEVDLIIKAGNYGWNHREGAHNYRPQNPPDNYIDPVIEHPRGEAMSITGGYVYRGNNIPGLYGAYVYGDYVTGLIWFFRYENAKPKDHSFIGRIPSISSFGEDKHGELYLTSFDGHLYQLLPGR